MSEPAEKLGTPLAMPSVAMTPVAMTIAGSDPSGGAGLQADLKTFQKRGVYGTSVVTLLTVQNTQRVSAVEMVDVDFVAQQLDAVLQDVPPNAAKTGALGTAPMIEMVAGRATEFPFPLVVDPVMISKHGDRLIDGDAINTLRRRLLPVAFLVTPNRREAEAIAQMPVDDLDSMESAARAIADLGAKNVLVKGGILGDHQVDILWAENQIHRLSRPRVATDHVHGTGCVLSAAVTAGLASGHGVVESVGRAVEFLTKSLSVQRTVGRGIGPIDFLADL